MQEIETRHRKEIKELNNRIIALKKTVGKGAADKQKKKQVMQDIQNMEQELQERHKREIQEFQASSSLEIESSAQDVEIPKTSKKSKQRKRIEERQAKLEKEYQEAMEEAKNMPNLHEQEIHELQKQLEAEELLIKDIRPDGHCLFNSISDQLLQQGEDIDFKSLRKIATDYMRQHSDDFLPFLIDHDGDCF